MEQIIRFGNYVFIPEKQVAVVYGPGGFSRFLPPGNHFLNPFSEQIETFISTTSSIVKGLCVGARASGGIPISIEWKLVYRINPFIIGPSMRSDLARSLPNQAPDIAQTHTDNCIRQHIEKFTVNALCKANAQYCLERQLERVVVERLRPFGFEVYRIMLGTITMSPKVVAALEAAYERQIQAEGLRLIKCLVEQFSDDELNKLEKLAPLLAWELHESQLAVKFSNE